MTDETLTQDIEARRIVEALLFASAAPLKLDDFARHLPDTADVGAILAALQSEFSGRGVRLVNVAGGYMFQTAEDLAYLRREVIQEEKKLSRAALETLAIVAYKQPVTRAEIEEIRGVTISKGTLDSLIENGWVRIKGRRRTPGRPVTYGTTDAFLAHFSLDSLDALPSFAELKAAGLLDNVDMAYEKQFFAPVGQLEMDDAFEDDA